MSLCVRLKPGQKEPPVVSVEADRVVLKPLENLLSFLEGAFEAVESLFWMLRKVAGGERCESAASSELVLRRKLETCRCCDHAFGVKATQEEAAERHETSLGHVKSVGYYSQNVRKT